MWNKEKTDAVVELVESNLGGGRTGRKGSIAIEPPL
jgi:hypothetical protein